MFLQKKTFKQNIFLPVHNHFHISSTSLTENNNALGDLSISKSIENWKVDYKNKFTCFLLRCKFCNNMSLYINKITGKYY